MLMGIGLLPIAYFIDNIILKCILATASIILNIIAIVKNLKEKKENQL